MARAYGSNAQLLGAFESTYGTAPASGFFKLPFNSSGLGSEQGLIENDVLGYGRDAQAPSRDVINVEGDIVVPVDVRNIGVWLKALLGAPVTTETGPYVHTFKSGGDTLPSLSLEIGHPKVPAFYMNVGAVVNSMALEFVRSGGAKATINCIAQGESKASSSQGGTPDTLVLQRFNQFQGSIKKDNVALGNVTNAKMTYSNNCEKIENIRSDGLIDGVDPTLATLTGELTVRFADTTLMDAATAGTAVALEFAYTIDVNKKLVITAHEVYLPKPKMSIDGPGGIQQTYNWQSAYNSTATAMMTVVLTNDEESY